jgi:phosphoglycolate phosphatase
MTSFNGAVLFDADGTLLDTAPDLLYAFNCLLKKYGFGEISIEVLRPFINLGVKSLLKKIFGLSEEDESLPRLKEELITLYEKNIAASTTFFPDIAEVLKQLSQRRIPWGIVTNKYLRHINAILDLLQPPHRPVCIIAGDSLPVFKPDPLPILHACALLKRPPTDCLYVGDAVTDVMASKGAGTKTIVALYGYIPTHEDPLAWQADGYITQPIELLKWL